ncbi:MAG: hypothetical protein GWN84_16965 [Gammaproteobacteria bacterium]|nr:hypothetical protein [Gammaproteobacteria bacterium]NIR84529.1 hypothetical protein [Gammaproteobacteria bacterium]NIR90432.1 hypothetical protein [Gammaproteobacteria bacterium]NIU05580.1 hypothetical protein [Gammaproteobacteria bacterium]NIV52719.1 hypothetical protein [Gammaproteobacteria bacterium]
MTDHYDGRRFHNPNPVRRGFFDFLRWQMSRDPGEWKRRLAASPAPSPPQALPSERLRLTFVNHATVLVQTAGLNVLTDPHWSERASPLSWAGPRRHRPPGVRFEALPPIHAVLVSHNHYDHMDLPTLRRLAAAHDPRFIVPLGNRRTLASAGITRVVELDWWEPYALSGAVTVHAVPARHWSKRGLLDTNKALWAGFYLASPAGSVYFAGDTGMGDHFQAIRRRLGAPGVALLPIGAYLPRWFMQPMHTSPSEALEAQRRVGARYLLPIHHGTFPVGDDGQEEPVRDLRRAMRRQGVPEERVWILGNGESRVLPAARFRAARDDTFQRQSRAADTSTRTSTPKDAKIAKNKRPSDYP